MKKNNKIQDDAQSLQMAVRQSVIFYTIKKIKIIIKENKEFNDGIFEIINQCKKLNVIDYDQAFDDQEEALKLIQKSIDNIDKSARNEKILEEIH